MQDPERSSRTRCTFRLEEKRYAVHPLRGGSRTLSVFKTSGQRRGVGRKLETASHSTAETVGREPSVLSGEKALYISKENHAYVHDTKTGATREIFDGNAANAWFDQLSAKTFAAAATYGDDVGQITLDILSAQ